MSYTYPEAITALESIANDFIKMFRPHETARVRLVCDVKAQTASVTWDVYSIRVTMPVRPATSIMLQSEFDDWVAYLLHELGHPTFTDKTVWFEGVKRGLARMLNALEDVRMEKALIASRIVPNAHAVLSRLIGRKVSEARAGDWRPNARREFGWTVCVLGRAANGYAIDPSDLGWIKSQIKAGSTVSTVLGWALPALAACGSTADCLALAERIAQALAAPQGNTGTGPNPNPGKGETGKGETGKSEPDDEAGEPDDEAGEGAGEGEGEQGEKGKGEGEGAGEPAEGYGEPSDEGEADIETDGEGDGGAGVSENEIDEGDGEQGENEGDGEAGKGGTGHGDGTFDSDEKPVNSDSELTEHALAPEGDTMSDKQGEAGTEKYVIDILRSGVVDLKPNTQNETTKRLGANGVRMKDAAAQASRQRTLLARALRANDTDDREGGRKNGRLDRGALTRAMAGSPHVFARRELSEGYDTDVSVLLDASGSMAGHNMIQALETGLVIAQAAGSVGATCTTEIFNSSGYTRAGAAASKRIPNPADFGALQNQAGGGTPLSGHMARAAIAQARRAPQKRRVLFIVTDGACDYGPQTVKRMATYLEQACGVVLAHVSIGTPLTGAFRAEVCVPNGTPLAKVGLEHFVKVLQAL